MVDMVDVYALARVEVLERLIGKGQPDIHLNPQDGC